MLNVPEAVTKLGDSSATTVPLPTTPCLGVKHIDFSKLQGISLPGVETAPISLLSMLQATQKLQIHLPGKSRERKTKHSANILQHKQNDKLA